MELIFRILAVILIGIAAYFLWNGNGENAFVSAVLGAASFFLSIRFQVKDRLRERELEEEEFSESNLLSDDSAFSGQMGNGQRTTDDEQKVNL